MSRNTNTDVSLGNAPVEHVGVGCLVVAVKRLALPDGSQALIRSPWCIYWASMTLLIAPRPPFLSATLYSKTSTTVMQIVGPILLFGRRRHGSIAGAPVTWNERLVEEHRLA